MKPLLPPLSLILTVVILWLAQSWGVLPSTQTLLAIISDQVVMAGVIAIGVVAILENTVGLNTYFPGAVVILGVMAATYGDPAAGFKTFVSIVVGQSIGLCISWAVGVRFGTATQSKIKSSDGWRSYLLLVAFWHPHSAAVTSFALGARHHSHALLIILGGCFVWSIFWALVMYFGLGSVVQEIGWDYVTIAVAIVWLAFELWSSWKSRSAT